MRLLPDFLVGCTADGHPAIRLPIMVEVKMREKNDYRIVVGLTDDAGNIEVRATVLEDEIDTSLSLFPSDYSALSGPNGAFAGILAVHPMNVTEVEAALRAYDVFQSVSAYPKDYRANLEEGYRQLLALSPRRIDVEIQGMRDGTLTTKVTTGSLAFPAMASSH